MRCLSCEIHVIYRIVLAFSKEAIIMGRQVPVFEKLQKMDSPNTTVWLKFETPELSKRSMKGGIATIVIDKKMENSQKKVQLRFAKELKKTILNELKFGDMLDEGFIEIHSPDEVVELIDWEEMPVCRTKKLR